MAVLDAHRVLPHCSRSRFLILRVVHLLLDLECGRSQLAAHAGLADRLLYLWTHGRIQLAITTRGDPIQFGRKLAKLWLAFLCAWLQSWVDVLFRWNGPAPFMVAYQARI